MYSVMRYCSGWVGFASLRVTTVDFGGKGNFETKKRKTLSSPCSEREMEEEKLVDSFVRSSNSLCHFPRNIFFFPLT